MEAQRFHALLQAQLSPEDFVRRAIRLLEADFRERALLTLSDWERLSGCAAEGFSVAPELYAAIAALQRPSWGNWNGLFQGLRKASIGLMARGSDRAKIQLLQLPHFQRELARLDAPLEPAVAESFQGLARLTRTNLPTRPRTGQALAMPITLRNRIAHDLPTAPEWWAEAAAALRPLIAFHCRPSDQAAASPWLLDEQGEYWSFNGMDNHFVPVYVSRKGETRHDESLAPAVLLGFRRLLGHAEAQDRDVRRLLARHAPEEVKGVLLGDYLLGPPVGSGGFATVHVGRQLTTGRKVALKVLRDGATAQDRARFQQEAESLARVDSRHVVTVVGQGESTWQAPRTFDLSEEAWFVELRDSAPIKRFIALEWVPGMTLEQVIQTPTANRPGLRQLATWIAEAADGVAAIHDAGLIHRDLKPSNLMLDADGRVKVMDLGIARPEADTRTVQTTTGRVIGTPAYMAPEQLRGEAGPASDLYGLCAAFYELVTGARLYRHDTTDVETVKQWKREGRTPERPGRLMPGLAWEIETLLLGGLEASPADRPASAAALAADVRRFLADQPIRYRSPPMTRRLELFCRRNSTAVRVAMAALLLLLIGGAVSLTFLAQERGRADEEKRLRGLADELAAAKAEETERERVRRLSEEYLGDMQDAPLLFEEARIDELLARLSKYQHPETDDPRGFEWHFWWNACHSERRAIPSDAGPWTKVAFAAGGERVGGLTREGRLTISDPRTGTRQFAVPGRTHDFAFGPDKKSLLVVASSAAGEADSLQWWDVAAGRKLRDIAELKGIESVAISPDGTLLLAGTQRADLPVVDIASGKVVVNLVKNQNSSSNRLMNPLLTGLDRQQGPVLSVCFSPDGRTAASASEDGTVKLWDVSSGKFLRSFTKHPGPVTSVAFSPDGKRVVSSSVGWRPSGVPVGPWEPGDIRVHDVAAGTLIGTIKRPEHVPWVVRKEGLRPVRAGTFNVTFTPDGKHLVGSIRRVVMKWEVTTGKQVASLRGHTDRVTAVAIHPTGESFVSASADGTLKIWDAVERQDGVLLYFDPLGTRSLAVSPDGRRVAAVRPTRAMVTSQGVSSPGIDFGVWQWDSRTGKGAAPPADFRGEPGAVGYSTDGRRFAAGGLIWDAGTGKHVPLPEKGQAGAAAISPNGRVAALGQGTRVTLWSVEEKIALGSRGAAGEDFTVLTFSPDGGRLAGSGKGGVIRVWSATEDRELVCLKGHEGRVRTLAFSPDGESLASGGDDRSIRVWELKSGRMAMRLTGHSREVTALAFSPDRKRLASASGDPDVKNLRPGEVKLWDLATGRDCLTLAGGGGLFGGVAFSPDGSRLFAGVTRIPTHQGMTAPGGVLVWEAGPPATAPAIDPTRLAGPPGRPGLATVIGLGSRVKKVCFSPMEDRLAAALESGTIAMVDPATGRINARLNQPGGIQELAFSPDGKYLAVLVTAEGLFAGAPLHLWDVEKGTKVRTVESAQTPRTTACGMAFNADGTQVLIAERGDDSGLEPGMRYIVTVPLDGGNRKRTSLTIAPVWGLSSFSPDGSHLLCLPLDREGKGEAVEVYSTATGARVSTIPNVKADVLRPRFTADAKVAVVQQRSGRTSRPAVYRYPAGGGAAEVSDHLLFDYMRPPAALSLDFRVFAASADGGKAVAVHDRGDWRQPLQEGDGPFDDLALSPKGRWLAAAVDDRYRLIIRDLTVPDPVRPRPERPAPPTPSLPPPAGPIPPPSGQQPAPVPRPSPKPRKDPLTAGSVWTGTQVLGTNVRQAVTVTVNQRTAGAFTARVEISFPRNGGRRVYTNVLGWTREDQIHLTIHPLSDPKNKYRMTFTGTWKAGKMHLTGKGVGPGGKSQTATLDLSRKP